MKRVCWSKCNRLWNFLIIIVIINIVHFCFGIIYCVPMHDNASDMHIWVFYIGMSRDLRSSVSASWLSHAICCFDWSFNVLNELHWVILKSFVVCKYITMRVICMWVHDHSSISIDFSEDWKWFANACCIGYVWDCFASNFDVLDELCCCVDRRSPMW